MENGLYEVCFKPLDKYYKLISFDFDLSDTDKGLVLSGIYFLREFRNNGLSS